MKDLIKRKEVCLDVDVIKHLQNLADAKKWSLKKYMEVTLIKESFKSSKTNKVK